MIYIIPISGLIIFLSSFYCGILIFFHQPQQLTKKLWGIFSLFVSLWAAGLGLAFYFDSHDLTLLSFRISHVFAIFVPVIFFNFVVSFTSKTSYYKSQCLKYYLFTLFYFVLTLFFPQLFIEDVIPKFEFNNYVHPGIIYYFFPIYFIYIIIHAELILIKNNNELDHKQKNENNYVILGSTIGFIGGLSTFFYVFDIPIPPYIVSIVPFFFLLIYYRIIKYNLMDIRIVIKKSLVYSVLITSITLLYFLLIYVSESFLKGFLGYRSLSFSFILSLTIAILFLPIRNFIQLFVDRLLFKGTFLEIAEQNERLRDQISLSEKHKAIATLASGIAHEIKNPLTAIQTFCEYLPQKLDDKAFLNKFSKIVGFEVSRINGLVNQLMDFSKPIDAPANPVNITQLIEETLDLLSSKFLEHKVVVDFHTTNPIFITIDANQIKQALLNIILNGIEAMSYGGTISIVLKRGTQKPQNLSNKIFETDTKSNLTISIKDTGPGMDKAVLLRIFEPFYTNKDSGTGLGLAITYDIIEKHNGKIEVKSQLKLGTEFIITLPI